MEKLDPIFDNLGQIVQSLAPVALAVSGGIDSMTLAVFAHRLREESGTTMVHAVSPAVPPAASQRVREWAQRENWDLRLVDAGEFLDQAYMANPVNRCFFCKGNLYGAISRLTERQILSGTNADDLGEYRPGLVAAKQLDVRHPYVEANLGKSDVRALARWLGMGDLSELPSSPCLSSRIETGIAIDPQVLAAVNATETLVASTLAARTVRCRVRRGGLAIELDEESFSRVDATLKSRFSKSILELFPSSFGGSSVAFEPYRNGSAFVGILR